MASSNVDEVEASSNVDEVEASHNADDKIENEADKKDDLDWDDFVDDIILKDLELTHSDEDRNVGF